MSTHAPAPPMSLACNASNRVRAVRASLRRDLLTGRTTISAVLTDPPDEILGVTVFDVLRWLRYDRANNRWEHQLGRLALRDGVNVFVRIGDASPRTVEWVVEHGQWQARRRRPVPA